MRLTIRQSKFWAPAQVMRAGAGVGRGGVSVGRAGSRACGLWSRGGGVSRSSRVSESNFIRMELSYPDPCYTLLA